MGQPVVHFEIIGRNPAALRGFYQSMFGWEFDTSGPVVAVVSEAGNYGFVDRSSTSAGVGIPGGVGGGAGHDPHVVFYVGVPDVEVALQEAERLGATRRWGPEQSSGRDLVVGQFIDPEGNLIGVAGSVRSGRPSVPKTAT
jgi:predicted enzyme related to lactoylglutathione lyase